MIRHAIIVFENERVGIRNTVGSFGASYESGRFTCTEKTDRNMNDQR